MELWVLIGVVAAIVAAVFQVFGFVLQCLKMFGSPTKPGKVEPRPEKRSEKN